MDKYIHEQVDDDGTQEFFDVDGFTPYAQIPQWVLKSDGALSGNAVQVYGLIMSYADNETRSAFPSRQRLAQDMGRSLNTVKRALKELEDYGALVVVRRRNKRTGNFYANRYTLRFRDPKSPWPIYEPRPRLTDGPITKPTNLTKPTTSLRDHPSGDHESSLRSPSPSGRCATPDDLRPLVKAIATATTADGHEKASYAFLEAFQDLYGTEPGYWDSGWVERLDSLVREHGTDYGCAKWLGIITNTTKAA